MYSLFDIADRANQVNFNESAVAVYECPNIYLMTEAEEQADSADEKKDNIIVRILKSIRNAIEGFFRALGNMFTTKEAMTVDQYLASEKVSITLRQDVDKLNQTVDDEIRKGSVLLQKISSVTGISDKAIDDWIGQSGDAIKKIEKAGAIVIPAAIGFGFRKKFRKDANVQTNAIDDAMEFVSDIMKNSKKVEQSKKVTKHMKWLNRIASKATQIAINTAFNAYKKSSGTGN